MENQLENKLSMYQKVQGFLTLHAEDLASISAVSTLKTDFDSKIVEILELASVAGADITGYTVEKQNKRMDLKKKVMKLSTALVAYGALNNDQKLVEKCDETSASIDRMRDNDFYTYSKLILSEAQNRIDLLIPYGVTQVDYTQAEEASTVYLSAIQDPRVHINERSMSLNKLDKLFSETDDLLNAKMDKVMKIFSVTHPDLFEGYDGARGIDQTGSRTPADYVGNVEAGSISLVAQLPYLAGRQFEVQNTGSVPLTFALSVTEGVLEGKTFTVEPGKSAERTTSKLNENPAADRFYVQNTDAVLPGSYKVWIIE